MISFACKTINFDDLIRCSFNLNKTEYFLFLFLLTKKEPLSVSSIAEELKKDRTTIQKAMKQLQESNLVIKYQINLEGGGYSFVYKIKNKSQIKEKLISIVTGWTNQVKNYIQDW